MAELSKKSEDPSIEGSFSLFSCEGSEGLRVLATGSPVLQRKCSGQTILCSQPWLGGVPSETYFLKDGIFRKRGGWSFYENASFQIGWFETQVSTANLELETQRAYSTLLNQIGRLNLYRIWNYVPGINVVEKPYIERYQIFCRGRSHSFEEAYGGSFTQKMPAASAVGCLGDNLKIYYISGKQPVEHLENPNQIPAYKYPEDFGPRSPSFSRASVVETNNGRVLFVSGTSSIRGSESVGMGNLQEQTEATIDNLRTICREGMVELNPNGEERRHYRVYLRKRTSLPIVEQRLRASILRADDSVIWVEGDICRSELELEIEITVFFR